MLLRRADAQAKWRKNLDDLVTQVKAVAPQYAQAQAVSKRNCELWGEETVLRNHHSARWSFYGKTNVDDLAGLAAYVEALPDKGGYFGRFVPGCVAYWPTYRESRANLLAEQEEVYELARPRPHRYELKVL